MEQQFLPPVYLRNPHLQTILNSQGPKRWRARRIAQKLNSQRLLLETDDGVTLVADFDRASGESSAVVVLLHGWEGCSESSYQITTARQLLDLGFDVLRVNLRDHGDSHHLNPELFNSTLSGEVADAIESFLQQYDYPRVFLAGYSLGGSFALRIAADAGERLGIAATVTVCSVIAPANTMNALNEGWFVYERYFFRKWVRSLRKKLLHFPELGYGDHLESARSLNDVNEMFIPNHTPYSNPAEYFAAYAITGERLADLSADAHLILAVDDPIIPVSDATKITPNPRLFIDIQTYGGHCGFLENLRGDSWVERRMGELFLQYA